MQEREDSEKAEAVDLLDRLINVVSVQEEVSSMLARRGKKSAISLGSPEAFSDQDTYRQANDSLGKVGQMNEEWEKVLNGNGQWQSSRNLWKK